MYHIREFYGIPDKEDRKVISHQIIDTLIGVKLNGKSPGVPDRVRRTFGTDHGRKADKNFCDPVWNLQKIGHGIFGHALIGFEIAECAGTFCMNHPFGNTFSVKVGDLIDLMNVLQQGWSVRTHRQGILVIGNRTAQTVGHVWKIRVTGIGRNKIHGKPRKNALYKYIRRKGNCYNSDGTACHLLFILKFPLINPPHNVKIKINCNFNISMIYENIYEKRGTGYDNKRTGCENET